MTILVTGAGGQVGSELLRRAGDLPVRGLVRAALDITDAAAVAAVFAREAPRVVINAAAWTSVVKAEAEPEAACAANRDGAAVLASACARAGIPLLHLSTDQVFSGSGTTPWRKTDPVVPLGVYGASKAAGEKEIRRHLPNHLILRVSWLFGFRGRNFVRTLLAQACEHHFVRVVGDQVGGPTPAAALADALLQLAGRCLRQERLPWGTYHFCGTPFVSRAQFAEAVYDAAYARSLLLQRPLVEAIAAADWPGAELRPANARLDCSGTRERLGLALPDWRQGLADMLDEMRGSAP